MHWKKIFALVMFSVLLAACGGGGSNTTATPVGDAAAGQALFNQMTINTAPGCATCHSIAPGETKVGPSLAGVASAAGSRVNGQTAEQYLRTSILDPNAYIVPGFNPGVMYQSFKTELTDKQVNDLVAYLLTLK